MQARSTDGKIICPRCKHSFSGERAVNYEIGSTIIKCEECTANIEVFVIAEYQYELAEDQDDDE